MPFVTEPFQAFLSNILGADDVHIPLSAAPYADLLKLLTSQKDAYTFLTLKDDTHSETVKARAEGGYILLERGLMSTQATKFPYSTCVTTVSPTVAAVIHDALCSESLCAYDPDAMGSKLGVIAEDIPAGKVGVEYDGYIIIGGTLPITMVFDNVPNWMTIKQVGNMASFSGKPTSAGKVIMDLTASNISESKSISHTMTVNISAQ